MHREGISRVKSTSKVATVVLLAAMLFAAPGGTAAAALPAPNWMPGSPILAGQQLVILFSPVVGAVKYNIYLNGKKVQETPSIQAIIAAPEEGGDHTVEVAAVDSAGVEGPKSVAGRVTIVKLVPPKGLNVRAIGKGFGMFWEQTKGAILYNVYRKDPGSADYKLVDSVQDIRWTDSKVEAEKEYSYRISAKDSSGKESALSQPAVGMIKAASAAAEEEVGNVTGLRTKVLFKTENGEITEKGKINFQEPFDIEISPDGKRVFFTNTNTQNVIILSVPQGEYLGEFGNSGEASAILKRPYGLAVTKNEVFVADIGSGLVKVYDHEGRWVRSFGPGKTKLDWMKLDPDVQDVGVAEKGEVFVLDRANGAVLTYSPDGKFQTHFNTRLKDPREENSIESPTYLKYFRGALYVTDNYRGRVVKYDLAGKILSKAGTKKAQPGGMQSLAGFDVGPDGLVFLADLGTNLIQVYNIETRKYLYTLANEENKAPANVFTPRTLVVDPARNNVYVAQGIIHAVTGLNMFGKPEVASGK